MATVICPNCGGENDVTKRGGQECAYCGTMLHLPTPTEPKTRKKKTSASAKELSEAKYIVQIAAKYANKEEVIKALEAHLVMEDNVPEDIFDHIEIKSVKWLYLPMWRYNGTISTEWSCDEVIYKKRKVGERPIYDSKGNFDRMEVEYETYEDYLPRAGHGHTSFDILVPAIKGIKEDLPYFVTDFNEVNASSAIQLKSDIKPTPLSASIRKITKEADSESVLNDVAYSLKCKADECSYGNLTPRSSRLPHFLIEGRECVHENLNFTYKFNNNGTVGELYYIPFVYVVYSYKGDTYDWGFAIDPNHAGDYDRPEIEGNIVDDKRNAQEEELKQVEKKWIWNIALSFVFSILIGCIIFFCLNNSLYERVIKRLKNQCYMGSLRGKYQRRDNLIKRGANKKTIADINSEIEGEYGFDDYDTWDDKTPKSITEIDEYYATTAVLKRKLLKRMRQFWVWYISLIVITAVGILGFNYWDNIQKEKMWEEEAVEQQNQQQKLYDEVSAIFNSEMIGKTFESYNLYHSGKHIRIKIIDNTKLQYQLGEETNDWDEHLNHVIQWEKPKIVNYKLDIERINADYGNDLHTSCCLSFDGYKSSNLIKQYAQNKFADEFTIPINKGEHNSYVLPSDNYYLKLKK
ncbi:hypothetical protein [uncultured Duncaniella sp.]|uniref:hypothetical protein n=1 Tax=uncultured Duncaniella sp. TaxID=2768039 RepID=UPI00263386D1|nr:hypothetical protein [uncultured Duncaniella sp.]